MEIILRQGVENLGKPGDVVKVKSGYARNYLLPQGLAYEATEGNKKRVAAEGRVRAARDQAERSEAERLASSLSQVSLKLSGKAGEEGKLFGSITSQDIADALGQQGYQIDRRKIELDHPIKTTGAHTVSIRLHPEVHAQLGVSVVPE